MLSPHLECKEIMRYYYVLLDAPLDRPYKTLALPDLKALFFDSKMKRFESEILSKTNGKYCMYFVLTPSSPWFHTSFGAGLVIS